MRCIGVCKRELPASAFRGRGWTCRSCGAGQRRFVALARNRPHWRQLNGPARQCLMAWETARLAFSRALLPFGYRVEWRGFKPVVLVVPITLKPLDGP